MYVCVCVWGAGTVFTLPILLASLSSSTKLWTYATFSKSVSSPVPELHQIYS